ncbi:MAG TPA: molecular chaperone DnaK [Acidobacteriota bacterium]|nr:molecular chaperone DnaK [Acidobacteriota bacterium]
MDIELGIDLGTTYSVASYLENGLPKVISTTKGTYLIPSLVAYTQEKGFLVGEPAQDQRIKNPEKTIASIKRWMGKNKVVKLNHQIYSPEKISALILKEIKRQAEAFLGEEVRKAVITVPAYFNDNQRKDTLEAARLAGLEVMRIINEPTAAALSYGLDKKGIQKVLVWDLGGGTFDVSILELGQGVFEVKAVNGNTNLGGDDWDYRIRDYLLEEISRIYNDDIKDSEYFLLKLKDISEKAKKNLSTNISTTISLPSLDHQRNINIELTREKFEDMCQDLIGRIEKHTVQALNDTQLKPQDIDKVVLVGGSTRMPAIRKLAKEFFGKDPYKHIDPDKVVAMGAAIQAGILAGKIKDMILVDVTPLSLGIETMGGISTKIINRNSPIPTSHSQIFTTAQDNQSQVDIHVLQGERALAKDNISLGNFCLKDISPSPRGVPQIEVTFHIDSNGILQASALDLQSENQKSIEIQSFPRLCPERINKMLKDARKYQQKDDTEKKYIQTKIRASSMISAAHTILEKGDKFKNRSLLYDLDKAIHKVEEALKCREIDIIKRETEELKEMTKNISSEIKEQGRRQEEIIKR